MAANARQAKDSELTQYATEIKVRAERRCGELLAATGRHQGGNPNLSKAAAGSAPTLSAMGLTRHKSSRYQQLAAMLAESIEAAIATAKDTAGQARPAEPATAMFGERCQAPKTARRSRRLRTHRTRKRLVHHCIRPSPNSERHGSLSQTVY